MREKYGRLVPDIGAAIEKMYKPKFTFIWLSLKFISSARHVLANGY